MRNNLNIDSFIQNHVTFRKENLIKPDFEKYNNQLSNRIDNKSVLVIGGASDIGSSYVKTILKFNIKKLVVIDTNENRLIELAQDVGDLIGHSASFEFITYPVSVGDRVFKKLFMQHGPFEIVANFDTSITINSPIDIFTVEAMMEKNVFLFQMKALF